MDFEKVEKAIEASSQEIKDILFSEEVGKSLQNIADENNLNEETSLKLIDEVGYLILGLKERSLIKSLLAQIEVPKESIPIMIQQISREIFSKLDKIKIKKPTPQNKTNEPIIITKENKVEAMKELDRRVAETPKEEAEPKLPEIKPDTHPMIEPRPSLEATAGKAGEKVHDVPHTEENKPESRSLEEIKKKLTEQPKVVHYTDGKDPYREPIE